VIAVAGVPGDAPELGEGESVVDRQSVDEGAQEQGGADGVPERPVGLAVRNMLEDGIGDVVTFKGGQSVSLGLGLAVAGQPQGVDESVGLDVGAAAV
jgi:hypothetical protein